MRENAAQTEPAARLVAVTTAIAQHLPNEHAKLGQSLQKAAARVLLLSLQGQLHRPTVADRARGYAQKCADILSLLDRMDACDPGMLQKAQTLGDKVLKAIPEGITLTSPVPAAATRQRPTLAQVLQFTPLAETGFRIP
jgi:hypothetical protein